MHIPVREHGYFDINLYVCDTLCNYNCDFGREVDPITDEVTIKPNKHKFSVKHELLKDAQHL
jgi:hypothetical protein